MTMDSAQTRKPRNTRNLVNSSSFDTALGWQPGKASTTILRIAICAIILFVFAGPILTIIAGAFGLPGRAT